MTVRTYDLTGWNDEKIEKGDYASPGWHHASITDVIEDFDYNSITLELTILGGPSEGKKVKDVLKDFEDASITNAARKTRFQIQMIRAKRLGLLPPEDQRSGEFSIDWMLALNKECFIKVQQRSYQKQDGTQGAVTELTFDGIYPPDDDRVPEAAKQHEPCDLDVLSEADQKRKADKVAAKEQKAADKSAEKATNGSDSGRKRATTSTQTDFGDI